MPRHALALAVALAAGCATPYQPMGFRGGFAEQRLDARTFQVMARGNGFTSRNRVDLLFLCRSAELTLQSGFDYFYIVGGDAQARVTTTPGHYTSGYYNGRTYVPGTFTPGVTVTRHEVLRTIWVLTAAEAVRYPGAYDARRTLADLGPRLQ